MEEELCLVDSATTNSILRELKYFQTLKKMNGDILTIAGRDTVIVGTGRAIFTLSNGTQVTIEDALLYPDSSRTLISYRDICKNGFHIETHKDNKEEYPTEKTFWAISIPISPFARPARSGQPIMLKCNNARRVRKIKSRRRESARADRKSVV